MGQDPGDEPEAVTAGVAVPLPADDPDATLAPTPLETPAPPPEEDRAERAEKRAQLAEERLNSVLVAYRQAKVENEGFRDRVTRDAQRESERHNQKLLLRFIEVLDNLDRALEASEGSGNPMIDGLILVRTQLLQILQKEGLERVPVLGLPFDPTFSEAVGTQLVTDPDHDHVVVKELQRGYRLFGRLARASRVFVGVYREGAAAPAAGDTEGMVGADEIDEHHLDAAAETIRLDEKMLREIFGQEPEKE